MLQKAAQLKSKEIYLVWSDLVQLFLQFTEKCKIKGTVKIDPYPTMQSKKPKWS